MVTMYAEVMRVNGRKTERIVIRCTKDVRKMWDEFITEMGFRNKYCEALKYLLELWRKQPAVIRIYH